MDVFCSVIKDLPCNKVYTQSIFLHLTEWIPSLYWYFKTSWIFTGIYRLLKGSNYALLWIIMSVQNICTFTTDQPVKVLYVIQVLVQVESNNHVPFFQISSGGLRRSTSHENKSRQHPKHKYRISWKDRHTFSPQISISKLGVNSSGDKNGAVPGTRVTHILDSDHRLY